MALSVQKVAAAATAFAVSILPATAAASTPPSKAAIEEATARFSGSGPAGVVDLELGVVTVEKVDDSPVDFTLGGRILAARGRLFGFAMGFDYDIGSSTDLDFHYRVATRLGPSLRLGASSYLAATAGIGMSGRTGDDGFGVDTPIELRAVAQVHRLLRASAWAQAQWVAAADIREQGSPTLSFADEFRTGASIALARPEFPMPGVALGAEYVEQRGQRGVAVFFCLTMISGSD